MKPYGVPRNKDVECPDVADIQTYGLKTSVGGKDYFRNKKNKASARRIWKKKARREGKNEIERSENGNIERSPKY